MRHDFPAIDAAEWAKVEDAAIKFWDEIAAESPTKKKVVDIFKKYNADMQKAGRPYRYGRSAGAGGAGPSRNRIHLRAPG